MLRGHLAQALYNLFLRHALVSVVSDRDHEAIAMNDCGGKNMLATGVTLANLIILSILSNCTAKPAPHLSHLAPPIVHLFVKYFVSETPFHAETFGVRDQPLLRLDGSSH